MRKTKSKTNTTFFYDIPPTDKDPYKYKVYTKNAKEKERRGSPPIKRSKT